MNAATAKGSLAQTLFLDDKKYQILRFLALAFLGTLILALSAKIKVPFYPVPMTLQTLAVFGIAAAYGQRLAVATVALYLIEGLLGFPVFASEAAGPTYVFGPTGGYLAGFLLAAYIVGTAADWGWSRQPVKMFGAMLLADALVFLVGFSWLAMAIGAAKAFQFGVVPFLLSDLLKIALATVAVAALWKLIKR